MTTNGETDAAGNEGAAPGTSGTGGAQGRTNPVPETAGQKWDIGKYAGAGATGDAPTGTYAGTPTSASGGIPATGEGEMSTAMPTRSTTFFRVIVGS